MVHHVEATVQKKSDEQFPLLMVAGAGDAVLRPPPPPLPEPVWSTTSVVPEPRNWGKYLFSTCWMTSIFVAVTFLVFYGVCMVVVNQPEYGYSVYACRNTSTKRVSYHLIIPRGEKNPLKGNSLYVAKMASKYPQLMFKVYLLIDDSDESVLKLYERMTGTICAVFNSSEIEYLRTFPNVNVCIMPLSQYMSFMRKWRDIPTEYLLFYARIFSVWVHGGVSIDLAILGNRDPTIRSSLTRVNERINAILTQHSNEISPEKYEETLVQLTKDNNAEITQIANDFFSNIVMKMLNDTVSMFHRSLGIKAISSGNIEADPLQNSEQLVRTHRAKRNVENENNTISKTNTTKQSGVINIILSNTTVLNVTTDENVQNVYDIFTNNDNTTLNKTENISIAHIRNPFMRGIDDEIAKILNSTDFHKTDKNNTIETEILFLYDVAIIPGPNEPIALPPQRHMQRIIETGKKQKPSYVVLDSDGIFVASPDKEHYFLGHIFSKFGKRVPPKYVIENALMSYCGGYMRPSPSCNSIFIL